jgi:hypothetical protein
MASRRIRGSLDRALGKLTELEGRFMKLQGHLKVLQGRARRARGTARLELARLERQAARNVARVDAGLRELKGRLEKTLEVGRRGVASALRSVEPSIRRSLERAGRLGATARTLPRAVREGIRARQARSRKSK